jgi:hypothetical protein
MNDSDTVEVRGPGFEAVLQLFKDPPIVKVGILGDGVIRSTGGPSNTQIGMKHEFGTTELPQRSFLRMPLIEKLDFALSRAGFFSENTAEEVIKTKSVGKFFQKIGFTAVAVVLDAFNTGGFGQWKPSNMKRKKVRQTLVETQQLRNSISSAVVKE